MTTRQLVFRSLLILPGLAAAACGRVETKDSSPAGPVVPVVTARAAVADVPMSFEAGGIVRARLVASVSSRVLAPIAAVRVRPGDRVRAGQPLVSLDARQLDADVRRTAASLTAAERGARAAEADAAGAEASLASSRATRDRVVSLFTRRSVTAQERDDVEAAVSAADARAAGAQARAAGAAAAVEAAKAAADAASISASYATLAAPFDGVVAERHADPGDMASPGAPLLTIENADVLQLEVKLDEARVAGVAIAQPVQVRFDAPDSDEDTAAAPLRGLVAEIGRVDPASHSFLVKIDLPGARTVRSGMFGRAVFDGPARRALVVPGSSVVRRGQLVFVFAVENDVARLRPVSIGPASPARPDLPNDGTKRIEITAGLSAGELVIADPPESLRDGARVRDGAQR